MRRIAIISLLSTLTLPLLSQDELSYAEQLKAIEEEMDSLSIFNLIDSLFTLEIEPSSELNVRIAFTNNVTSAGRDYDLSQNGASVGISYYHKSGLYSDLAGYWNSGIDPNYNPTVFSIGYLGSFKNPKWGYSLDAERWFYNPKDSSNNPLTYSLGASVSYDFKWGFTSVDYSFLFGQESANRFITNLSGNIPLGKWWVFKSINLYPSASMMSGNSDITQLRITTNEVNEHIANRLRRLTTFAELNIEQKRILGLIVIKAFNDGIITEQARNQIFFNMRNSSELTPQNRAALQTIANSEFETTEYADSNEFGVLNYSFTIPLSLSTNRFYILLSYTYSIPIQLPGEFIEVDHLGYFGASVSYRIPFK